MMRVLSRAQNTKVGRCSTQVCRPFWKAKIRRSRQSSLTLRWDAAGQKPTALLPATGANCCCNQWCRSSGCRGCVYTPKNSNLLKIRAKHLKIRAHMFRHL